ncbi:hypothetical protein [Streptomyces scabiei]|uniref:Uncharacterized protein n=1 Tax=Streptomyces scabiei TaxID=1930 RepID=A0A124C4G1_STRSC|nr:hypothetical protein [Streptomyces scabiei]GAQ64296.1 hypothetical protein SsS58_04689 [Streptomyces scabiei]
MNVNIDIRRIQGRPIEHGGKEAIGDGRPGLTTAHTLPLGRTEAGTPVDHARPTGLI